MASGISFCKVLEPSVNDVGIPFLNIALARIIPKKNLGDL
ncbi:hypothetical protein RintRC_6751 [Richelia intracellularis]|nr:hypothetical protein RintRC_6751 [Richelia intracellularis]